MFSSLMDKLKSLLKALGALIGLGVVIKLLLDRVNPKDVLQGNTDVLKTVDSINEKKAAVDELLKQEQANRDSINQQNDQQKQENLTNEELADFFNNRK